MRELLLGFSQFTEADHKQKLEFAFTIFDEDNNGYITEPELMHILKANHLATELQAVRSERACTLRSACSRRC